MPNLGKVLKDLRKNANMTQKELAKELGISKSVISGYEQAARLPSTSMLLKIANVFNVSVDYLCGIEQERRMLDISDLTDKDIEFLRTTLRFLRDKNCSNCNMR